MAYQPGRNVIIAISDGGSPEAFTPVGYMTVRRLVLSSRPVDATNMQSAGQWREIIGGDVRSVRAEGSGVFKDSAAEEAVRAQFFSNLPENYQLTFPSWGTLTGLFMATSLTMEGRLAEPSLFGMVLESSGEVTWSAV